MVDHWEVDGNLVTLEEELREGAFGKVYKGVLKAPTTPSQNTIMMPPINEIPSYTVKMTGEFTVAVKMLHGKLHCVFRFGNLKSPLEVINKSQ